MTVQGFTLIDNFSFNFRCLRSSEGAVVLRLVLTLTLTLTLTIEPSDYRTFGLSRVYRHFGPETLRHQCRSVRKTYRHWYQTVQTLRHRRCGSVWTLRHRRVTVLQILTGESVIYKVVFQSYKTSYRGRSLSLANRHRSVVLL